MLILIFCLPFLNQLAKVLTQPKLFYNKKLKLIMLIICNVNNLKGNCMRTIGLLFWSLVATNTYSVQMYQCEDEAGNIQYTQTPSPNCVEVKPAPIQSISVPPSEKGSDSSAPAADNPSPASTPPKPQTITEGCKIAADTLQKIAGNIALAKPDKNDPGKMIPMTKAEIEQERVKAQDYFDAVCKEKSSTAATQPSPNEAPAETETNSEN
jgi:hypothetical protein